MSACEAGSALDPRATFARGGRYTLIGALCALANNVILIGGDLVGLHYLPASFVALLLVTPPAYMAHCRYTFGRSNSIHGFLRFASGIAMGFLLSLALMALFCTVIGFPVMVGAPATTVILFVFNYCSAHWAIMRRPGWR